MTRPDGWDTRFNDLIEKARSRPFEWGENDCCTFAIENFRAVMLADPPNMMTWKGAFGAQRVLARHSVEDLANLWFGEAFGGWMTGRRGDVALIDSLRGTCGAETSHALSIIVGARVCCPGEAGLEFAPLKSAIKVWHVG